jgi:hypothetical protein
MSQTSEVSTPIDIAKLPIEHGVLIGNEGELYLMGGMHWILQFAVGAAKVDPSTLETFFSNIELRRRVALRFSARYLHLIAPEKYVVVPENMPFPAVDFMARAFMNHELPDVVYPRALLTALGSGHAYYKTDSHWAVRGRVAIARLIAEYAGLKTEIVEAGTELLLAAIAGPLAQAFIGDLGRKFDPPQSEVTALFRRPYQVISSENGLEHVAGTIYNDGRLIVATSECENAVDQTLLIFGDSYLHLTIDFLAAFFKTIVFCRSRFLHDEIVSLVRPHMIVTQNAERYLNAVESDTTAPAFLLVPYLLGRKPIFEEAATKAIAAVLRSNRDA